MTKILDCTTRDGGYNVNWNYDCGYIIELIEKLNKTGVEYYEIGYRNYFETEGKGIFYRCTPEVLEKFYNLKGKLKIGVMVDTKRYNAKDFLSAEDDFTDFVRVACHPEEILKALEIADELIYRGYNVFVHLMDVSNIGAEGFIAFCGYKNKEKLESLYFADSYGIITPEEAEHYYNKFKTLGYDRISFHAHNKRGFALQNTQKAIELGAYSVDVSRNGAGRNGGNLDADELFISVKF